MVRLFFAFLLLFSINVYAQDECMTGMWFDADRDGEGISLSVDGDQVYGTLYSYRGTQHDWFVFAGDRDTGTAELFRTYAYGVSPWQVSTYSVGDLHYEVVDQNNMNFVVDLELDVTRFGSGATIPWCLGDYCQRSLVYTRLTDPIACAK